MPLHDVGYRSWNGVRQWHLLRWLVIALTGIQLVWRGTWLRRFFVLSLVPTLVAGASFLVYESSLTSPDLSREVVGLLARRVGIPQVVQAYRDDPVGARHQIWASLLLTFFRYPQLVSTAVIIGIIAPRLISYDLRSRGFLLYFSRPISTIEYIFGKSAVIWFYLALSTTVPALCLFVIGVLSSTDINVIWVTWDLPLRILVASAVLILPTATLALALSALTTESRYAAFGWFAIWIVGWVAFSVLTFDPTQQETGGRRFRNRNFEFERSIVNEENMILVERWVWVSPYHLLGKIQQWVFGLNYESTSIWPHLVVVAAVTLASFCVVYYQVSKQQRI